MGQFHNVSLAALAAFSFGCGQIQTASNSTVKEAWNAQNDPSNFNVSTARFSDLPLEGVIPDESYPWSDDYWATKKAGTAYRWQQPVVNGTGTYQDYRYQILSRGSFVPGSAQTAALVDKLSPAEKYDLLLSRYNFPLVQAEFNNQAQSVDGRLSPADVPEWFGICHGWAPATIMEKEPGSKAVMTNAQGIQIPFYTSDINALMSKVYADSDSPSLFIGERCPTDTNEIRRDITGRVKDTKCRDTNPATLHLVLTQMLGAANPADRRAFVADVSVDSEVWNQAVTGFKVTSAEVRDYHRLTDPAALYRARGTKQLVHVKAEMLYISEEDPHTTPIMNMKDRYTSRDELEYTLELDRDGVIIGGEWISAKRPDFLWLPTATPSDNSTLSYSVVRDILDRSR